MKLVVITGETRCRHHPLPHHIALKDCTNPRAPSFFTMCAVIKPL